MACTTSTVCRLWLRLWTPSAPKETVMINILRCWCLFHIPPGYYFLHVSFALQHTFFLEKMRNHFFKVKKIPQMKTPPLIDFKRIQLELLLTKFSYIESLACWRKTMFQHSETGAWITNKNQDEKCGTNFPWKKDRQTHRQKNRHIVRVWSPSIVDFFLNVKASRIGRSRWLNDLRTGVWTERRAGSIPFSRPSCQGWYPTPGWERYQAAREERWVPLATRKVISLTPNSATTWKRLEDGLHLYLLRIGTFDIWLFPLYNSLKIAALNLFVCFPNNFYLRQW